MNLLNSVNKPYYQSFFSGMCFLSVELSHKGIFFTIVNKPKGAKKFDWPGRKTAKFSISELTHLSEGLEIYRNQGEEAYKKRAMLFSISEKFPAGNPKFTNIQFIHKTEKGSTRAGFNLYNGDLYFIINDGANFQYKIQFIDLARLDKYLKFLVNQAFEVYAQKMFDERMEKIKRSLSKSPNIPPAEIKEAVAKESPEEKILKHWKTQVHTAFSLCPDFETLKLKASDLKVKVERSGIKSDWLEAMYKDRYKAIQKEKAGV